MRSNRAEAAGRRGSCAPGKPLEAKTPEGAGREKPAMMISLERRGEHFTDG